MSHCSELMAAFRAVYSGSRSIRDGIIWLVFTAFVEPGAVTVSVFVDRIGVETLTDGRLKAAGSMSGIVDRGKSTTVVACSDGAARDAREQSWVDKWDQECYAIAAVELS